MTKEPLKSLIRRKFLSKQNEHSANISEHWNEFSMFTSEQCVNIRKLPNSLNMSPGQEDANRPQVDMLKELLLPFEPWRATLSLDSAGRIQVKASRLLLPQMQAYCEQHGPELQAFLKSRPGHTWSTMRKS